MSSTPHLEALEFFRAHAEAWQKKATQAEGYNVIRSRREYALEVFARKGGKRALDVGCGSGELVCELLSRGVDAFGIDFAPEMIGLAKTAAAARGVSAEAFRVASVLEMPPPALKFDLVVASGFIEYLTPGDLERCLLRFADWTKDAGHLVVDSRNRLFNLVSLNAFTRLERDGGHWGHLVDEALVLTESENMQTALETLRAREHRPAPVVGEHPHTGIGVKTRHQYTPGELVAQLETLGWRVVELRGLHPHAFPPALSRRYPGWHEAFAQELEKGLGREPALLPYCSSFTLTATRVLCN